MGATYPYQSHSGHHRLTKRSAYLYTIRVLKYIFVLLAGCLLTLHSLTPHQHEKVLQKDMERQGVLGLFLEQIADIFGQDLGEGHLEDYTYSQKGQDGSNEQVPVPTVVPLAFVLSSFGLEAVIADIQESYIPISEPIYTAFSCADLPSRAPPALI